LRLAALAAGQNASTLTDLPSDRKEAQPIAGDIPTAVVVCSRLSE
jgi:hypothetical protein